MCRYILDTDCVSLILYNHPQVTANVAKHQVAVTIVTVQELFNGWIGRINDPSMLHNLPALYSKLWTTVKYLQTIEVLDFTAEADTCLKKLLKDHPPLRKNRLQKDMRIAAIALSVGATVVTRNQRDFAQVPGLSFAQRVRSTYRRLDALVRRCCPPLASPFLKHIPLTLVSPNLFFR